MRNEKRSPVARTSTHRAGNVKSIGTVFDEREPSPERFEYQAGVRCGALLAFKPHRRACLPPVGNRREIGMKALSVSDTGDAAESALTGLPMSRRRHREEADDYPAIVALLDTGWRVIECRDSIQWIVQRRAGKRHGQTRWESRCFCRTREGLLRRVRELAGGLDATALAILEGLHDWIGGRP